MDALPRVTVHLPVHRQVVHQLRHHHIRQQAVGRHRLGQRLRRHARHMDRFPAVRADDPVLDPHHLADEQRRRLIVQLLADLLADPLPFTAQRRQLRGGEVNRPGHTGQIVRDLPAAVG